MNKRISGILCILLRVACQLASLTPPLLVCVCVWPCLSDCWYWVAACSHAGISAWQSCHSIINVMYMCHTLHWCTRYIDLFKQHLLMLLSRGYRDGTITCFGVPVWFRISLSNDFPTVLALFIHVA